ncbi:uncharacterized protein BX663DRAFT_519258 [Cokeromyces recurvatus]|uniref:uncharacterized protein n=1 Tax=Cokeromyces recurvatus TaxID=90255 RepID=UPI00221F91A1|nr:uncharacterized protein BX663DRAFT_519258 [Cokeromyces recurvatus]KAI7900000.1 hypothetical protein BX663DRAFT_519258 [Cokeromyces recurvatus]
MNNYGNQGHQGYEQQHQSHFDNLAQGFNQLNVGDRWNQFQSHLHRPWSQEKGSHHHQQHAPGEVICGPLLKYIDINYTTRQWRGSILIVSSDPSPPPIQVQLIALTTGQSTTIETRVEKLDSFRQIYHFWRYDLRLKLTDQPQRLIYSTPHQNWAQPQFEVHLPAYFETMRFMFYSCNGFSDIPQEVKDKFGEKEAPLWQDVLDRHEVMPFHVLLGGGDQLYQDRLIKEDFMKPWVAEKDPVRRLAMKLSPEMKDGFEEFYFSNYCKNFGFKENPVVAKAFATIPSINMWDDHDIIDGYGSYPTEMQRAECFQVLFANASRFYYLFQHHTTIELATQHGMIRGSLPTCNHIISTLGPDIGFIAVDCRGERTKMEVCQASSYDTLFRHLSSTAVIPPTVKHLFILTGVPLIYPRLTLFENLMDGAAGFNLATIAGKTGALGDIIGGQLNVWNGDPELLDDMNDHWTAGNHEQERKIFIERLQSYARERSIRVSFLGGDVHCCGAGKLYSKDMKEKEEGDPYFMVQIISSAIVNVPPPQALLTVLNQNSGYITFNGNTEERMYNLFKKSPNGNTRQNKKLMGMRNYCAGYYDEKTGKVNFWIQAEKEVGVKGTMGYLVDVPKLVFGQAGYHLFHQDKKQILNDLYQQQKQSQIPFHYQQQQGRNDDNSYFQRLQSKIGGFVMPQP